MSGAQVGTPAVMVRTPGLLHSFPVSTLHFVEMLHRRYTEAHLIY